MAHTIEILIDGKSPRKIKEKDHAITAFIKYLDKEHPGWEESIISNKQIYLVKSGDRLIPLKKAPAVGHLLDYLEQHHQDWLRFGISRITFPIIKYEDCRPGMLVRPSSSNTSMYQRVEKVVINSKGEKAIICCQEGNTRTFNTVRNKKFRFALLAANIPAADLKAIDWPGRKVREDGYLDSYFLIPSEWIGPNTKKRNMHQRNLPITFPYTYIAYLTCLNT